VPVVVAVNGVAGWRRVQPCDGGDIIVAARSAKFIQVFSRIGLVPDLCSTWLLPRLIGRQRALELMLLNEPLSAERALEWGLVRQVVDDDRLRDEAMKSGPSPRRGADACAGRDASVAGGKRACELQRAVSPGDRGGRPTFAKARMRWKAPGFVEKRAARFGGVSLAADAARRPACDRRLAR